MLSCDGAGARGWQPPGLWHRVSARQAAFVFGEVVDGPWGSIRLGGGGLGLGDIGSIPGPALIFVSAQLKTALSGIWEPLLGSSEQSLYTHGCPARRARSHLAAWRLPSRTPAHCCLTGVPRRQSRHAAGPRILRTTRTSRGPWPRPARTPADVCREYGNTALRQSGDTMPTTEARPVSAGLPTAP